MGNVCFRGGKESDPARPDPDAALQRHEDIERDLRSHAAKAEDIKLLLLGPGESGKSTIFKQMKIISLSGGYSREDLINHRFVVFGNTITQMKVLVNAARKMEVALDSEEAEAAAERIATLPTLPGDDTWSLEVGMDIQLLWKDRGIQATYDHRDRRFQLNESAGYFFDNIERFMEPDYIPTVVDILRARVRSLGIEEAVFQFDDMSFRLVDVAGQRSERRKWIHCFECVTAVLFVTSLNGYDQTLREDDSQNRMKEALLMFDEICNSPWFTDTAFILFLNKTDLFKEKIHRVPLSKTFSSYTGGASFENASAFIKARFLEVNTSPHVIFTHFTCAVDTKHIEFVFKCVRETILQRVLEMF